MGYRNGRTPCAVAESVWKSSSVAGLIMGSLREVRLVMTAGGMCKYKVVDESSRAGPPVASEVAVYIYVRVLVYMSYTRQLPLSLAHKGRLKPRYKRRLELWRKGGRINDVRPHAAVP